MCSIVNQTNCNLGNALTILVQAIVAAGFRIEEYVMIRVLLDELQAQHVKVIIGDQHTLLKMQSEVLALPEIDWSSPREARQGGGGGWGSQRAILFSGLSIAQQVLSLAAIVGDFPNYLRELTKLMSAASSLLVC
jgi:hypothetical protein